MIQWIKSLWNGCFNMNSINSKRLGLTNNQLKIIAAISMLLDHVGLVFFYNDDIYRILGRLAFPIYAFLISEGCRHTKNRAKYLGLIATMGFVFQIFYLVFMNDIYQGILVTFSLSITIIFSIDTLINNKTLRARAMAILGLTIALFIGFVCPELFGEHGFVIDYSIWGISLPVLMYFAPNKKARIILLTVFLALMGYATMANNANYIQWWALLSVPFIALYNGERGKAKMKYFFYIFYPLHIVLIFAITIAIAILK